MNRRHTHQKDAVLSAISGPGKHMTAEEVLTEVHITNPEIGQATVYRNLNLLVENGMIQKIEGEGYHFFDGNPAPHSHMICKQCGSITDVFDYDRRRLNRIGHSIGAYVESSSTIYFGVCKDCLKKDSSEKN